jgi:hypothetical protein
MVKEVFSKATRACCRQRSCAHQPAAVSPPPPHTHTHTPTVTPASSAQHAPLAGSRPPRPPHLAVLEGHGAKVQAGGGHDNVGHHHLRLQGQQDRGATLDVQGHDQLHGTGQDGRPAGTAFCGMHGGECRRRRLKL